ncbi:T9SS type A sorting domain-containing protein [Chryseobacterium sp. VD8]|uniref:T9SS type A sorting domain-containing protein n=1 Tax=Chryseobacterium sp. VD8 TaxID=3081254 RepID=UPI00301A6DCD
MKKILLIISMAIANLAWSQFTTSTVSLGSTGMTVKIDTDATTATITLTGSSTTWLAIGFGGTSMSAITDYFIWNSTTSRDYTGLSCQCQPTADASQSWTVTSDTTSGTVRTVVATRPLTSSGDYTFLNNTSSIPIIYAKGSSTTLSQHSSTNRGSTTLTRTALLATNEAAAQSKKVVLYPNPAKETVNFKNADKIKNIDVFESTGRKVKTIKADGKEVNIFDLKSGNYYLEIALKDGTTSFEKLIKE